MSRHAMHEGVTCWGCCSWIWRGAFLAFESLLTLQITSIEGDSELHKSLRLYRIVAAVSLLCCSGLYVLGGILCFGRRKQGVALAEASESQVKGPQSNAHARNFDLHHLHAACVGAPGLMHGIVRAHLLISSTALLAQLCSGPLP